jgi:hypothetical protein
VPWPKSASLYNQTITTQLQKQTDSMFHPRHIVEEYSQYSTAFKADILIATFNNRPAAHAIFNLLNSNGGWELAPNFPRIKALWHKSAKDLNKLSGSKSKAKWTKPSKDNNGTEVSTANPYAPLASSEANINNYFYG